MSRLRAAAALVAILVLLQAGCGNGSEKEKTRALSRATMINLTYVAFQSCLSDLVGPTRLQRIEFPQVRLITPGPRLGLMTWVKIGSPPNEAFRARRFEVNFFADPPEIPTRLQQRQLETCVHRELAGHVAGTL